ncbi:MAG TPA: GNAT family N-acetyltransferase [Actinomycetota bacterium]|nr:GNAT family N-acetyltransferase [Actinomycetota bacterium]
MEFRAIEPEELDAFLLSLSHAFSEVVPDEEELEADRQRLEPDRCFAAFDEDRIVGCAGAFSWRTTVPGGAAVPTAGVTTVGVLPTHRRRGITRELMGRLLDQAHERQEPLATLFASQGAIYGRFGYGMATALIDLDVLVERAAFVPSYEPHGRMRLLDRDQALPLMRGVYDAVAAARPGMLVLSEDDFAWLNKEYGKREEKLFYAVHEDDAGTPDAYVTYRAKHEWPEGLPHVELKVRHLFAATPQGAADVWRYLLDIDLISKVLAENRAIDEPLRWLVQEHRAVRTKLFDGMYLRPVDVSAALAARGYAADGRVVLRLADPFVPRNEGTFELVAGEDGALCVRTDADADLAADVTAVGAVYLGGVTWRELARAGRAIELTDGAADRADLLFASDPPPWEPLGF